MVIGEDAPVFSVQPEELRKLSRNLVEQVNYQLPFIYCSGCRLLCPSSNKTNYKLFCVLALCICFIISL